MKRILVIEDEQAIADTVIHCIEREGFLAEHRTQGLEGLALLRAGSFDLVVLDVGLPDVGGFELCKDIRAFSGVPIIFLTARDDEIDKIVGLEIGADDYMTKPFSPRELGVRIKAILRRAGNAAPAPAASTPASKKEAPLCLGGLRVDLEKMAAVFQGCKLELTRYEFKLLALLAKNPGKVFSREALMRHVWDDDSPSLERTVDAHVKTLRSKFREVDEKADLIQTRRGTGYALRDDL